MADWTLERAGRWLLDWLLSKPATQPGGLGEIVQESISGEDGPPWNLIKSATESLILSGIISAKREYTMPSDGTPAFYQRVKFTPKGLRTLTSTSRREEIGFKAD